MAYRNRARIYNFIGKKDLAAADEQKLRALGQKP